MKAGVQVLGISVDPVESHKKFCESLKLPFPLLSDKEGKVSALYGIAISLPGGLKLSGRSAFLVDREGVLRYADPKYDLSDKGPNGTPSSHDRLWKAIEGLGKETGKATRK